MMRGRKRRFGVAGALNVLLTNLALQLLLLVPGLPASLCTLTSQALNGCIGFLLYGKWVFQSNTLSHTKPILRYATLQATLWQVNWLLISIGEVLGMHRNIAALIAITPLAVTSYFLQKNWVFKTP